MKRLEQIQSRKTMSSYGGVGSIIETKDNGSLLVDYYNNWGCYQGNGNGNVTVEDDRLLKYIQDHYNLPYIVGFRLIPTPKDMPIYWARRTHLRDTMQSRYFPGWFYCRHCHKLHRIEEWKYKWETKQWTNRNGNTFRDNRFDINYPACPDCSTSRGENQISRKPLEQIRFCMASLDSGKVMDIPFDLLFNATKKSLCFNVTNAVPVQTELEYRTSPNSDGLQSNYILLGGRGGQRLTMALIESKYIVYEGAAYKLVLRNQNNIYYPDTVRAIYIPRDDNYNDLISRIMQAYHSGSNALNISTSLPILGIPALSSDEVQSIIEGQSLGFDMQEYAYITNQGNYSNGINHKEDYYAMCFANLQHRFVKKFYAISRLREDSTIPRFCRISNKPKDWFNVNTERIENDTSPTYQYTFDNGNNPLNNPTFLPIVKAFGEGLFLDIDTNLLPQDITQKDIFVHTFSHLIMKELEFECGYSIQSLKEKLYKKQDGSAYGILIYTIGASEGSYGGLVSLLPNDVNDTTARMMDIIDNALERAKDCLNDPICSMERGHCFACVDIPEISCCQWNNNLDRRVVNKVYEASVNTNTPMASSPSTPTLSPVSNPENSASSSTASVQSIKEPTILS